MDGGNDRNTWKAALQLAHGLRGETSGWRATGLLRGTEHGLGRVQELRCFSHELHAAKDDDVSVSLSCPARQIQGIADVIRDRVEEGWLHVVVPKDQGVFLHLELVNLGCQLRLE